MKSVAFFNNKGGVGKTTLLCNVAAFLALNKQKQILIIDVDPQCNATQLLLEEPEVIKIYDDAKAFTIHSIVHPLSIGKGYSNIIQPRAVSAYGIDLIPGDPRLALKEDLLSKDWQDAIAGQVRGLRTSVMFSELLGRCGMYDYVFFDMGPSLGSINRAVLLSCDFFISPMSIDIFSLKAIENISVALMEWKKRFAHGVDLLEDSNEDDVPAGGRFNIKFAGYVAQHYIQKTTDGEKRAVAAFENIMKRIPKSIKENFVNKLQPRQPNIDYEIGTIPNLYSLIPMSQTAHKPVFELKAKDGVRGAHFSRVRDALEIYESVCSQLVTNLSELS